jgi:hypothetical protein
MEQSNFQKFCQNHWTLLYMYAPRIHVSRKYVSRKHVHHKHVHRRHVGRLTLNADSLKPLTH